MKFLFVGGSADGKRLEIEADKIMAQVATVPPLVANVAANAPLTTNKTIVNEDYIKLNDKESGATFFMRCGMTPRDAVKRYKELTGGPATKDRSLGKVRDDEVRKHGG